MQTFLPYADFHRTAQVLDPRRLGKQRVEAHQILSTLADPTRKSWQHHPAVLMWRGYEDALRAYMNAMIEEWKLRGYTNTMQLAVVRSPLILPPWLGDERLHSSHRANLLRKDPEFYGSYGWSESTEMPYFWPVSQADATPSLP